VAASSNANGRFTKETLSPSKNLSEICEGRSGVAGNFASAAQLIPCYKTAQVSIDANRIVHAGTYQDDLTVLRVAKGTSVYTQPDGRHNNHKAMGRRYTAKGWETKAGSTPIYQLCVDRCWAGVVRMRGTPMSSPRVRAATAAGNRGQGTGDSESLAWNSNSNTVEW
jgi:hypothetical protein